MLESARSGLSFRALALLLAGLATACGGANAPDADEAEDAPAITLADLGTTEEARTFLASGSVWSEDLSPNDLRALIDELYAAGAPRVVFGDIEPIESQRVSALLAVEMPADAAARRRVLAAYNRAWTAQGEYVEKDTGQSWLTLSLD